MVQLIALFLIMLWLFWNNLIASVAVSFLNFFLFCASLMKGVVCSQVGMSIDPKLLASNFPVITGALGLLIASKTILVAIVGRLFGVSIVSAIRVGLLLAPGGEFAFVAFGEAVNQV